MASKCPVCSEEVSRRQQAVQCDVCACWQHRRCQTNITSDDYRRAVKGELQIEWKCSNCSRDPEVPLPNEEPIAESTRISNGGLQIRGDRSEASFGLYSIPIPVAEVTFEEPAPVPMEVDTSSTDIQYTLVQNSSERGRPKLCDNLGFSYTKKKTTSNAVYWRCSVRNRATVCRATVIQSDDSFRTGAQAHCHQPDIGCAKAAKVVSDIRQRAVANVFTPASRIVEDVLLAHGSVPVPSLSKPENLARQANYLRQGKRPKDPRTTDFVIDRDHIPADFLVQDLWVAHKRSRSRHIIFATHQMRELLATARRWYLDATFKVVREPFDQLFSIHAFVKGEKDSKQVPLVFALMSSRRTTDYSNILRAVIENTVWTPKNWSVFMQPIRTNNVCPVCFRPLPNNNYMMMI